MNNLAQAIGVELLKARRSRIPLFTALGFSLLPFVGGFFMIVLKDPELARRAGLIGAKARIAMGVADWPTYLSFLTLAIAAAGTVLFSLIGSWVFGREYSDHTVKDLLALPTARSSIVFAKFVVIAVWSLALVAMIYLIALGVGAAVALPHIPVPSLLRGGVHLATTAALTLAVITPIIFFASAGRGYLPPMGVAILAIALAQIVGVAGWGQYFPWTIPALYAQGETLGAVSYMIVIVTSIVGLAGTFAWWEFADQTH